MALVAPTAARSSNFWILPVEVLGSSPKRTARGTLKPGSSSLQCAMISSAVALQPGLSSTKAQGVSPRGIGHRDHGHGGHRGVAVERVLDLDAGDVLAAGDDDVLAAVLDADVAVGRHHAQVAGVEPAAGEGVFGGALVLQVALHADVAAEHDLAHGLLVGRDFEHGFGIAHRHAGLQVIAHALARVEQGALFVFQRVPGCLAGADGGRAVDLGQAVDVGQLEADLLHLGDHGGRGRGAGDHGADRVRDAGAQLGRRVGQRALHDGRAAVVRHAFGADQVEHGLGIELAQADVDAGARGHGQAKHQPLQWNNGGSVRGRPDAWACPIQGCC